MNIKKAIVYLIILVLVILNTNYETYLPFNSYFHRHFGKDGGMFRLFETTVYLSALYFLIMPERKRILFMLLGIVIGILAFILSLAITNNLTNSNVQIQILACILFIVIFHLMPNRWTKRKRQVKNFENNSN